MQTQTLDYRERGPDRARSAPGDLLIDICALRAEIAARAKNILDGWGSDAENARYATLGNLAHHLAAQQIDRTDIPYRMTTFGLASFAEAQAVMPTINAVVASLERLVGVPGSRYPDATSIEDGESRRRAARDAIFGSALESGASLIMTLPGEASSDPRVVRDLMAAGMTCARIDCADGDAGRWCEMIVNIRIAERELGHPCRIMMDVAGRRVRIAAVAGPEKRRVMRGDTITLTTRIADAGEGGVAFSCDPADFPKRLALGDRIWLNDERIGAQVVACSETNVHLEVTAARPKGDKLKIGRSVRLPGGDRGSPTFCAAAEEALDFIAENADMVACSFLDSPHDVRELQRRLDLRRGNLPPMPIVLAIETARAVAALPELIAQSASANPTAVLVSERAVSIECGPERLGEIRDQALHLCRAAAIPLVWSSAALDNLVREGLSAAPEAASAATSCRSDGLALQAGPRMLDAATLVGDIFRHRDRLDRHSGDGLPSTTGQP